MKKQIRIRTSSVTALAELYETKTAEAIWQALPLSNKVKTWGDEIYFSIPLKKELEAGQEVVSLGDLGYWSTGSAFCIFFGLTPVSSQDEIRPASAVDVFGHLIDDPNVLKQVEAGEDIVVERV
jgi:hypothetical protein